MKYTPDSPEEWRNLQIWDSEMKEHVWFSISTHGNLVSHMNVISKGHKGFETIIDQTFRKPVKFTAKTNRDGSPKCLYKRLTFPVGFFEDFEYSKNNNSSKGNILKTCNAHTLVMDTFCPIDENPPERLAEEWHQVITADMIGQPRIPQSYKIYIRDCSLINHKDHDPSNNCVWNLEWCTPKENAREAHVFYGGNTVNKKNFVAGKNIVDEVTNAKIEPNPLEKLLS
ncbi:hypothetical protein [Synechococcus phage S-H25]|nr:hypothetical protein [Synechococcus phage S-H25]